MITQSDTPFMQGTEPAIKLQFNTMEAAERLAADLRAIAQASTNHDLELLLLKLQAEKAAREIYALISKP